MTEKIVNATEKPEQMQFKTQAQLDAALREWQERLRLQDWEIRIQFADHDGSAEDLGTADVDLLGKTCIIGLTTFEEARAQSRNVWKDSVDMEATLAHELTHIPFEPFRPKDEASLEYKLWEQAVEWVARNFISLHRANKRQRRAS